MTDEQENFTDSTKVDDQISTQTDQNQSEPKTDNELKYSPSDNSSSITNIETDNAQVLPTDEPNQLNSETDVKQVTLSIPDPCSTSTTNSSIENSQEIEKSEENFKRDENNEQTSTNNDSDQINPETKDEKVSSLSDPSLTSSTTNSSIENSQETEKSEENFKRDENNEQTSTNNDSKTNDSTTMDVGEDSSNENKTQLAKDESSAILEKEPIDTSNIPSNEQWLYPRFDRKQVDSSIEYTIKRPDQYENEIGEPEFGDDKKYDLINRSKGSIIGSAIGDALGAHVEFRPQSYLKVHPVEDMSGGGTWGLKPGQFTDDTSMALCLATSLIAKKKFSKYDQLVRYKWWYKMGFLSSTGECFDIGNATRESIEEFSDRQERIISMKNIQESELDLMSDNDPLLIDFDCYCSREGVAGNGALMRLGPLPIFFQKNPRLAVFYSGESGILTHGDIRVRDACRYYGSLIVAALHGYKKDKILDDQFYENHLDWFNNEALHDDINNIAKGSYKKENGYDDGIRGSGYIVKALEAALWAFWKTEDFKSGALLAVNLGDDTDTTAAIYGQLAGAFYGFNELYKPWVEVVKARQFLEKLSVWLVYQGDKSTECDPKKEKEQTKNPDENSDENAEKMETESSIDENDSNKKLKIEEEKMV